MGHRQGESPRKPLTNIPEPQQMQGSVPGHAVQISRPAGQGQQLQQQLHQHHQQPRQEPPDAQERVMRTVYLPTSSSDSLAMRVDALQAQLEEQVTLPGVRKQDMHSSIARCDQLAFLNMQASISCTPMSRMHKYDLLLSAMGQLVLGKRFQCHSCNAASARSSRCTEEVHTD